jgi:hypothetical protein
LQGRENQKQKASAYAMLRRDKEIGKHPSFGVPPSGGNAGNWNADFSFLLSTFQLFPQKPPCRFGDRRSLSRRSFAQADAFFSAS